MEKMKKSKIRIALIAAGVLLISSAMLVTAILVSGSAEENKIIRTAYAQEGVAEEEISDTTGDNAAEEENNNTEPSDTKLLDTAEPTDEAVLPDNAVIQTNEPPAVETPAPQATAIRVYEPGPENISADEAIDITIEYADKIFGKTIDKTTLSANFNKVGYDVKHDGWSVSNKDYSSSIDAISGELLYMCYYGEYEGVDNITKKEFMELSDKIRDNPEPYFEKATEIIKVNLANDRNIEHMLIDGIQVIFADDQPQTIQVDCKVLMESGRSYCLSFAGSELYVRVFTSHPTQNATVFGYNWEEEASEYPDWKEIEFAADSAPLPTPEPTSAPSSESVSE